MKPQQFKIRISITSKLILLISFLLTTPIIILNISAITLFLNDKKAYVYDSQATSAALAGREFVSYLDNSLGTLKLTIGSADLSRPLKPQAKNNIQFYLDNQKALVGFQLYAIRPKFVTTDLFYEYFLPSLKANLQLTPEELRIDPALFSEKRLELSSAGYFFKNITRPGKAPILAIVLADSSPLEARGYIAVAVGYVTLNHFLSGTSKSFNQFSIIHKDGSLLFHSDLSKLYANQNYMRDSMFQEALSLKLTAGAKEYFTPDKVRTLGSFYKPGYNLVVLNQIEYQKAMAATYTLTEKFIMLALGSLGVMIFFGLLFSKKFTSPLKRLFNATKEVSAGNFNIDLPITSRDEIGALTHSFTLMSSKISDLIQEMVDKVRVDQELEIAKTVQASLFPPTLISSADLTIASHYQSASECGGDWWGYFNLNRKHVFIMADATGHGLPSALMTASARSCFSVLEKLTAENRLSLEPSEMLSIANRVVFDSAQGKIMMTCCVCIVDFEEHLITYASAAHNPPWLFSKKENGNYELHSLIARGKRLGEAREITEYETKSIPFQLNDTLVLYTDGLLEGKNSLNVQYGKKQARQILENSLNQQPQEMTQTVIKDFLKHNGQKDLDDDVTLTIVKMHK